MPSVPEVVIWTDRPRELQMLWAIPKIALKPCILIREKHFLATPVKLQFKHQARRAAFSGYAIRRERTQHGQEKNKTQIASDHYRFASLICMEKYIRQVVTEVSEIKANIAVFNTGIHNNYDEALSLARKTTYWVYDHESNIFGPSKFLGFKDMSFERYLDSKQDKLEGDLFTGGVRTQVEKVLGSLYSKNSDLADKLRRWGQDCLETNWFKDLSQEKWKFLVLPTTSYITEDTIQKLLALLRKTYPKWQDFSDADYIKDEFEYKDACSKRSRQLLARDTFSKLIETKQFDEIIDRLAKAGQCNLLWTAVPKEGDLYVLSAANLNKETFCQSVFNLLYGEDDIETRLRSYSDYLAASGIKRKWAFPTYLLYMLDPETNIFVKPTTTSWFLELIGSPIRTIGNLEPSHYSVFLNAAQELFTKLANYKPRNLIDVQSLIWIAHQTAKKSIGLDTDMVLNEEEIMENQNSQLGDLNTVLYGPPGTGKTYNTINYALAAIENRDVESYSKEERDVLRKRFADYQRQDRVDFVTFHQSFSYEDFIEGIKPVEPGEKDGFLKYRIEDGIFKRMCVNATYAIFHSLRKKEGVSKEIDFNGLYLEFIADLKEKLKSNNGSVIFKSRISKNIHLVKIGASNNIVLKHEKGARTYIVSKSGLSKLYKEFSSVDEIKNVYEDIRDAIGGCNTTMYWTIFNELKKFEHEFPGFSLADEELQEDMDYETKKDLISDFVVAECPENVERFVLIIDEINRGNVANIFGELITLIEKDKRAGMEEALSTVLPYSKTGFSVPPNLHIIGTMNTADRSVEALDTALRRRFVFHEKTTDLSLIQQPDTLNVDLQTMLKAINSRIEALLDKDHHIGHSYFMGLEQSNDPNKDLKNIFATRIIPLLEEYFYRDPVKIGMILGKAFVEKIKYSGKDQLRFAAGFENELDDFERKDIYEIKDPLEFGDMSPFAEIYE